MFVPGFHSLPSSDVGCFYSQVPGPQNPLAESRPPQGLKSHRPVPTLGQCQSHGVFGLGMTMGMVYPGESSKLGIHVVLEHE